MKLIRQLEAFTEEMRGGAVTVGNFDGVHHGHARIIRRLSELAQARGGPAVVFTFDPHPAAILRPGQLPPPLTTSERKAELLSGLGADVMVAFPTDEHFLHFTARQFFDEILVGALGAGAIVEGPDFSFGRGRQGNVDLLGRLCAEQEIVFEVIEPVFRQDEIISSSRIRRILSQGRVAEAASLLTEPYRVGGIVIRGANRGTSLGYPTANIGVVPTLLPCEGIYAGRAYLEDRMLPAAISLGPNPTFGDGDLKLELFLLDFEGDLYGRPIEVDFLARLRDIVRFETVDQLIAQMDRDVEETRRITAEAVGA